MRKALGYAMAITLTCGSALAEKVGIADTDRIGCKHAAWILPKDCDLSHKDWRAAIDKQRARMQKQFGRAEAPDDLQKSFIETMAFLFDHRLYDSKAGTWKINEFLDRGEKEFGGYDQVIIWQNYPRLGIDDRTQFDYFRDLPGGLKGLKQWVDVCRKRGVRTLLSYNPWDAHTRGGAEHLPEILDLLEATGADGMYLDTMHKVPKGWAEACRKRVGRPVYFGSEGAPSGPLLTKMHSSWGQGYTIHPPAQIFHRKWWCPSHKIFLTSDRHSRDHWDEVCCAFFTGTGTLVWENVFGNDTSWHDRDKALLRAVVPIQRAFWKHFMDDGWDPYVRSGSKDLMANRFHGPYGNLYTLCWLKGEAYAGKLIPARKESTYVDLITGEQLSVSDGFVQGKLGVRGISAVLETSKISAELKALLEKTCPGKIPSYRKVDLPRLKGRAKGTFSPRLKKYAEGKPETLPEGMVWAPGGDFHFKVGHRWHGASCYPHPGGRNGKKVKVAGFAIDIFPVTNAEYARFLKESDYQPRDKHNFLKHWKEGTVPTGLEKHPVVWVSQEDARAYAKWAGKRLPTEAEWQYAAQGTDGRKWPWAKTNGKKPDGVQHTNATGATQPVGQFEDASPIGVRDLCGNVWQWVDEVYRDNVHTFTILKGGSFYRLPKDASKWYIHTGPCPVNSHAKMPLLSPSLDRCATVGFRCVVD